ncbi:1-acylglycerol-3-phosphate O-acyltransferase [Diatrype stigma]|uniref:1-acyl-sn-glycerol-3-phosphate acyltransferase n=1 Tax=Diatrype stigma TaxID=117547 RepID=A0AAN9UTD4_9PEZI
MAFFLYLAYFIVGYTGLVLFFYALTPISTKAGFVARSLAAYISLVICAIYGIVASIVLRAVGREQIAQWATARAFKYIMGKTTGITFEVIDPKGILDTTRPAVIIGNHQTELDVLMLGCMFPKYCSVTAKKSLKNVPFLGQFMSLSGTVFIDRKNTKDARQVMAGAAAQMTKRKQSVFMFPEGTRTYAKEPELLPFKKGAFHLAVQAGVPIIPVVVANYSHVLYLKNLIFRSGKIPVKVLDPIPTTGLKTEDVDELTRSTRELFLKEYVALTQEAQHRPIAMPASGKNGVVRASGVEATLSG